MLEEDEAIRPGCATDKNENGLPSIRDVQITAIAATGDTGSKSCTDVDPWYFPFLRLLAVIGIFLYYTADSFLERITDRR